ncbi:MAG TPA: gfo/Idh/MocA family oxidoreductase, partial [Nitrospirae bacterium]|nr:gfo/Idh/MocA family oxidoreductase [Nitrospirota bacterium]
MKLAGIVDTDKARAKELAVKYGCRAYSDYRDMIDHVDAVSIAVPTTLHFQTSMDLLKNNKNVLVEKPITTTIEEADELISEASKKDLVLQVGHL